MSEGRIQQYGTPEEIYNEPQNAFVADFIGDSNIFNGIMTGKKEARFCGAAFKCVDDFEVGRHITAVLRPEDIVVTSPEKGIISGRVVSVIFKGIHYEITVESGKNEVVIQSVNSAKIGDVIGMTIAPDDIHIMPAEDEINIFAADITKDFHLEYNDKPIDTSVTEIIKGSRRTDSGLIDAMGDVIDPKKVKIMISIRPDDIRLTDDKDEGLVSGYISDLIYKGDHYRYVVKTESGQDFVVHNEYLWNMDDNVGLIMPVDRMRFSLKKTGAHK